jgi:uncharacterized lipoprotein YddW (UPF0748 family)
MKWAPLISFLFVFCPVALSAETSEVRGLWVVRSSLGSPESVEKVLSDAAENGFNSLFVQVRGRGDAFYRSRFDPRSDALKEQPEDFDPLDRLIAGARGRRLKVFAWVNVLLVQGSSTTLLPGHCLSRHPDWVMVPKEMGSQLYNSPMAGPALTSVIQHARRTREAEGAYLDPANPAVGQYLVAVCSDLVDRYDVHGIHLDYVRYPSSEFGYGRFALDSFAKEVDKDLTVVTRQRLRHAFQRDKLIYTRQYPVRWDNFRRGRVTALIAQIGQAVKERRPGTLVTAAVTGDSQIAYAHKLQDWKKWTERGLLDAVCPMAYSPDTGTFKDQVALARGYSFGAQVWAGIGSWQIPADSTIEKIEMSRKIRCEGFILFSYGNLSNKTENALAKIRHFLARPPFALASAQEHE